uniref:Uncharacterized protein n=1 Tax=Leptospira santarosai serovar Arenal str. MAVJ 401 TaxID=1049976 RepID=M6JR07_9LEPT|nr:hypothetical protein LEP1GSC063_4404 [Leptospira santarosai serovar Arenal str. MAVJ 401]
MFFKQFLGMKNESGHNLSDSFSITIFSKKLRKNVMLLFHKNRYGKDRQERELRQAFLS